jgi:hypothetical protein
MSSVLITSNASCLQRNWVLPLVSSVLCLTDRLSSGPLSLCEFETSVSPGQSGEFETSVSPGQSSGSHGGHVRRKRGTFQGGVARSVSRGRFTGQADTAAWLTELGRPPASAVAVPAATRSAALGHQPARTITIRYLHPLGKHHPRGRGPVAMCGEYLLRAPGVPRPGWHGTEWRRSGRPLNLDCSRGRAARPHLFMTHHRYHRLASDGNNFDAATTILATSLPRPRVSRRCPSPPMTQRSRQSCSVWRVGAVHPSRPLPQLQPGLRRKQRTKL